MDITLIYSKNDIAGKNMYERIEEILKEKKEESNVDVIFEEKIFNEKLKQKIKIEGKNNIKILETEERTIFLEEEHLNFKTDIIIFLNKHVAKSQNNAITVHSIGNFNDNSYGGKKNTLVKTNPCLLTKIFLEMKKIKDLKSNLGEYIVNFEATHHGPYSNNKIIYFELGAAEKNWNDKIIAKKIVEKLLELLLVYEEENKKSYFIIGGNHYVSNTEILTEKYCFYGSCPKYNVQYLNDKIILFLKNEVDFIVLDYDNMKEKERIKELLEKNNIKYYKLKSLKKQIKEENNKII